MKEAINPILFLLANDPASEQGLEYVISILRYTNEAVINIRTGLDNFYENILRIKDRDQPGSSP